MIEGYAIPLRRSLTEPILLGGAPRTAAILNGTLAAAFVSDYLPWTALIAPGVVLNKDGSFQRTAEFRGPDLESSTEEELVATCARINNALRRFGSGWALYFEAARIPARDYPESTFTDPAAWIVEQERRGEFEEEADKRALFESDAARRPIVQSGRTLN